MINREIFISEKAFLLLSVGRRIEGSIILNPATNQLEFRMWKRKSPKRYNYRVINHLPNSVLMESIKKVIVRGSVNKDVSRNDIAKTMKTELQSHMQVLEKAEYLLGE